MAYIGTLNTSIPVGTDLVSTTDDIIRQLKTDLVASFPSVDGAVTASDTELNLLDGVLATTANINALVGVSATSTVEARLAALEISSIAASCIMGGRRYDTGRYKFNATGNVASHSNSILVRNETANARVRVRCNGVYTDPSADGMTDADGNWLKTLYSNVVKDTGGIGTYDIIVSIDGGGSYTFPVQVVG